MKINVYPRRVRRAKLDLQVGNHPALYLVIAKKIVTVQSLYLLVFIFMKTRSLVVPPYADLDEKVLMQASLHKHFLIQTSAWLNCNKKLKYLPDFYCSFCICVVYLHIKVLQSD